MKKNSTVLINIFILTCLSSIVISCSSKVTGKVEDRKTGDPIESATVIASMQTDIAEDKKYERIEAKTTSDGTFTLKGLSPEYSYTVKAGKENYFSIRESFAKVTPPEKGKTRILDKTLKLYRKAPIRFSISDSFSTKPISGVKMVANSRLTSNMEKEYQYQTAISDENGESEITLFPDTEYNLTFSKDGYKDNGYKFNSADPRNELEIQLSPVPIWEKVISENGYEDPSDIQQTKDGGFIVLGSKLPQNKKNYDIFLIKFDMSGKMEWDSVYGGNNQEFSGSVKQTVDEGYIVTAVSSKELSNDSDGFAWVIKVDSKGKKQWDKKFWGKSNFLSSVHLFDDGGFILAGNNSPKGSENKDFWIIKLSSDGNLIWENTMGGRKEEVCKSSILTTDGGYALAGWTNSKGFGQYDCWVVKLNSKGKVEWDKTFGGRKRDLCTDIQETKDNGYVLAASTNSKGHGEHDCQIIKLNANGEVQWDETYGKSMYDSCNSIIQTADEGYIFTGQSQKTEKVTNAWIVKLDKEGKVQGSDYFGGEITYMPRSMKKTNNGGFVITGNNARRGSRDHDIWIKLYN